MGTWKVAAMCAAVPVEAEDEALSFITEDTQHRCHHVVACSGSLQSAFSLDTL